MEKTCPLLWNHLCVNTTGILLPCCESYYSDKAMHISNFTNIDDLYNSDFYQNIRKQMIAGEENEQCKRHCYDKERMSFSSKRLREREKYGTVFESPIADVNDIIYMDLKPSNYCNSQCVMCNPNRSSKIAAELNKIPVLQGGWYDDASDILKPLYKNLTILKINGGETSVLPELPHILEGVSTNDKINVILHINNTIDITKYHDYFKNIHVDINISVEGWGTVNDYIRYPSKWKTIYSNLKKLDDYAQQNDNISITLTTVMLSLNYLQFPSFLVNMGEFRGIDRVFISALKHPMHLHPSALTTETLEQGYQNFKTLYPVLREMYNNSIHIDDTLKVYELNLTNGTDEQLRLKFKDYINQNDSRRNINLQDYIKEIYDDLQSV